MKTLLSRLTQEHLEKLENLKAPFTKASVKTSLLKEFIVDLTVGEYLDLTVYIFEKNISVLELYQYFDKK